jgi:hypothetical protein
MDTILFGPLGDSEGDGGFDSVALAASSSAVKGLSPGAAGQAGRGNLPGGHVPFERQPSERTKAFATRLGRLAEDLHHLDDAPAGEGEAAGKQAEHGEDGKEDVGPAAPSGPRRSGAQPGAAARHGLSVLHKALATLEDNLLV